MMRLFQVIFGILWGLGYLGNGILFLYVEWTFLRQSFIQLFNPLLHLQVLGVLLATPLFWMFLAMAVVGYYATSSIERHLEQSATRDEINAKRAIPPFPQTFQERQSSPSFSSVQGEQPNSHISPRPIPKPSSRLESESVERQVELLKWAIQGSQKVQFSYGNWNCDKSDHMVTPIGFKMVEQILCLEGYCDLRRAKGTFAINRMQDIKIISESEVNQEQSTPQHEGAPYIDVQTRVNLESQSPPSNIAESRLESEVAEQQAELMKWAIQSSQKVQFTYEKRNSEKTDYTVTPIDFKTVEQILCLEGYCHLRRAKETFVISRMRDVRIVPTSEPSYGQHIPQQERTPYIDVQARGNPESQSPLSNDALANDTSSQVKQRPYIKYRVDEIERIVALEWNNIEALNVIYYELEFRSRKKALDLRERIAARLIQLQDKQFSWSTTANPGSQNLPSDTFNYEEGLLRYYGYKVGINGLPESKRWEILDAVFLYPLLQMDNDAYLSEWGEPMSAKRLQKLVESIAAFTRNTKRRKKGSFTKAIQDWETDLAYLKRTYYNNRCSFQYPRT
jgi:predicted DNA-binding transcriptional regulator YafY